MKVAFSDFWPAFDQHRNFLVSLFARLNIPIEVVDDDADVLIASCFGFSWTRKKARRRLYWTGENWYRTDDPIHELDGKRIIDCFDRVYSFDYNTHPNHYRAPLYLFDCMQKGITDFNLVIRTKTKEQLRSEFATRKFCTFVQGNQESPFRNDYFSRLNQVQTVDCFGPVFNNTGIILDRAGKIEKTREYKFALAFENSEYAGYVTEKLIDALVSDVIPVYWGGSGVAGEFNDRSFVDVGQLGVEPSLALVRRLNTDFESYWDGYNQKIVLDGQMPLAGRIDAFCRNFEQAVHS